MIKFNSAKLGFVSALILLIYSLSAISQNEKYQETGIASFYADKFEGRPTANGEIYYHVKRTAAHKTLPFGSIVKVTNLENNKYVVLRINDRGPFVDGRIIDLSKSAAQDLGFVGKGLAKVQVELIASIDDLPDDKPEVKDSVKGVGYYNSNWVPITPDKGRGVQVGSFREQKKVQTVVKRLSVKYEGNVYIEIAAYKGQKLYRVIIGNTTSEAFLEKLKEYLSKDYPDCFIVKYKK